MTLTAFAASMAVNTLATGLIVFKILKVFLEVKGLKANSVEGTLTPSLGSSSSAGGSKLQHVIFVIIESGLTLFVIQLIRVVFVNLPAERLPNTFNIVVAIHQMVNVII